MSLFKYFKREAAVDRGEFLPEETDRSTSIANQEVRAVVDEVEAKPKCRKVEPRVYSIIITVSLYFFPFNYECL